MIKEAIVKIVNKGDLTYDEAYTVMNEIMSGETKHACRNHRRNCWLRSSNERACNKGRN